MSIGSCDHTIHGQHHHNHWDHSIDPVLEVEPGATVEFETVDASGGQVEPGSTAAALSALDFARARWIVRPGNDIFLVWSHNWQNEVARLLDREFTTLSRGGAVKVNYSYRF